MIHIGIIGCGKIAQTRHIPEYKENKNACITGVYDLNQDRANKITDDLGCKSYCSYEELLKDESIDGVSVCTANYAHAEIVVEALKAGKHVLCEKPMATNLEDCRKMINAAKDTGRILMIGQNQRLTAVHKKAKEFLEEERIGKVLTFRSTFGHSGPENWSIDQGKGSWFFDKKLAFMGAMADLGIHKTDLIQFLLDSKISAVSAYMGTLDKTDTEGNPIQLDDNAICIYELENGCVGTVTASWTYYGEEDNSTILYGTNGIMRIYNDPTYPLIVELRTGEKVYYQMPAMQTNENQTKSEVIDIFINGILENDGTILSGESVFHAMEAVFAAQESAKQGKRISLL